MPTNQPVIDAHPPRIFKLCLLLAVVSGCGQPAQERVIYAATDAKSIRDVDETTVESLATPARCCIVVAEADNPPGEDGAYSAVAEALQLRGVEVVSPDPSDSAAPLVAIQCYVRAGQPWGGLPVQEVLLRYAVLCADRAEPVSVGDLNKRHADSEKSAASQGALRLAAREVAVQIARALRTVPASSSTFLNRSPASDEPPTLACLPFRNTTGQRGLSGWCETLATLAAREFQGAGKYRLVERARLREVLDEQDVTAALDGVADATKRVGTKLGVDLLLVGEVTYRPDGKLTISARLLRSTDAHIERVFLVYDSSSRVEVLEKRFRKSISRPLAAWMDQKLETLRSRPRDWPAPRS
jgi:TolB-like protein